MPCRPLRCSVCSSSSATACASARTAGGAPRCNGVSSSVRPLANGVQMNEMLCAMKRRALDCRAASTRLRVPSVRTRSVACKPSPAVSPKAVSWWITTSGSARCTNSISRAASNTSPITGVAPIACKIAAPSALRVIATTRWPACTSIGTSWRPMAPEPPAMKTFMARRSTVLPAQPCTRRESAGACSRSARP